MFETYEWGSCRGLTIMFSVAIVCGSRESHLSRYVHIRSRIERPIEARSSSSRRLSLGSQSPVSMAKGGLFCEKKMKRRGDHTFMSWANMKVIIDSLNFTHATLVFVVVGIDVCGATADMYLLVPKQTLCLTSIPDMCTDRGLIAFSSSALYGIF